MSELIFANAGKAEEAERSGDLDTAYRFWLEISSKNETPEAYFQRSRIAFMLGKWQMAETALLRTLEGGTNSPKAVGVLGALFLKRTDGDRASNLEAARTWLLRIVEIAISAHTNRCRRCKPRPPSLVRMLDLRSCAHAIFEYFSSENWPGI
jgi:hypothetical protein